MNTNEVKGLLEIMSMAYPQAYKNMTVDGKRKQILFWENRFRDYPADLVFAAAECFIDNDTAGFPPGIGQVKAICKEMTAGRQRKDLFAEAMKAVRGNLRFDALSEENKMFFGSQEVINEYGRMANFNPEVFRGQYDRQAKQTENRVQAKASAVQSLGEERLCELEQAGTSLSLPESEEA